MKNPPDTPSDLAPLPNTLLSVLYDGITAENGFQPFTEALARAFSLKTVSILTRHLEQQAVKFIWGHGTDPRLIENYALDYAEEDMLARHLGHAPIARFYASNLHLPESGEDIRGTRFYREWLAPQEIAYGAAAVILREGDWSTEIFALRSPSQPIFTQDEVATLGVLLPHLQRALQLRQRFNDLQTEQHLLTGGLDALAIPTFLVDEHGRLAWHNRQAGLLLDDDGGLLRLGGHITAGNTAAARHMAQAITDAINVGRGCRQATGQPLQIPRPGRRPLTLVITPLSFDTCGHRGRGAIIFAFDPEHGRTVSAQQMRRLFHLTPAEAELAAYLCRGLSLEACARARGVSLNTIRSQLRGILAKTGATRQADLLALLLTSPAYFLVDAGEDDPDPIA